jgi:2-methylisocitrate lyase-like PEP mutase family enzyme
MSLRDRLAADDVLVVPGAFDALTARLLQREGFEAIYRGGYAAAAAAHGLPDLGVTTLTENADHLRRIAAAVDVPVIADADTGYGEIAQLVRTVREFEHAGAAAVQIEDQVFPKRCGHMEGKRVIPVEEMAVKLRAAMAARQDPDTVIVARTDALAVNGLDDAIERARRYADLGADLIFVDAPTSEADLEAIVSAGIAAPLLVNVSEFGRTPDLGVQRFAELGFSVVLYPSSTLFAAAGSTADLARRLREEGSTTGVLPRMLPFEELNDVLGKDEWDAREDELRALRETGTPS